MSSSDYHQHAAALQSEADKAFAIWWEGLSAEEQSKAREMGVEGPSKDTSIAAGHGPGETGDAAESDLAHTFDVRKETLEDVLAEEFDLPAAKAKRIADWHLARLGENQHQNQGDALARIIGPFLRESNPKIAIAGLAYALGMDALNGLGTIRQYAAHIGVSAEAISKKQKFWRKELGLPPSAHSKSDAACKSLKEAQKTKHYKRRSYGH
jgi:hypothetical protein